MASRTAFGCSLLFIFTQLGCAASAEARPSSRTPNDHAAPTTPSSAVSAGNSATRPAPPAAAPTAADGPSPPPAPDPQTGEIPRAIPELKLKLSGLHIGGGPNDAVTKQPFIAALEQGFTAMRTCYTRVEQPEKGGTFGVDLRVDRAGGHPTLQAVRTVMKGDDFKTCVEAAFLALDFTRPAKGATVLSASVRFSLEP